MPRSLSCGKRSEELLFSNFFLFSLFFAPFPSLPLSPSLPSFLPLLLLLLLLLSYTRTFLSPSSLSPLLFPPPGSPMHVCFPHTTRPHGAFKRQETLTNKLCLSHSILVSIVSSDPLRSLERQNMIFAFSAFYFLKRSILCRTPLLLIFCRLLPPLFLSLPPVTTTHRPPPSSLLLPFQLSLLRFVPEEREGEQSSTASASSLPPPTV